VSLLVTGLLVVGGILVGRIIARGPSTPKKETPEAPAETPEAAPKPPDAPDLAAFPCHLGDVVLLGTGEEAWLAGALVLYEGDAAAAALFVCPEAGKGRAVLARPSQPELLWLAPEDGVVVALGDPPTALEVAGDRFERRRRLPLRARRAGSGAPDIGPDVILAEYTGLGDDALLVLATKERALAYRGPRVGSGGYDVLPGKADE
jgi:hypothetical protein